MTDLPLDVPELLTPDDFGKFKTKDESWFLGAVGDSIRDECGWHIYPVRPQLNVACEVGNAGIIMLPSLNVVSVEQVVYNGVTLTQNVDFSVHQSGWIELVGYLPASGGLGPQRLIQRALRGMRQRWVAVDFTHGFSRMPRPVSEVGFELTARTLEKPAGVAKSLDAGPNRFVFGEFGPVLSDDQRARLAPYSITRV